jgi:hypothetical protein
MVSTNWIGSSKGFKSVLEEMPNLLSNTYSGD